MLGAVLFYIHLYILFIKIFFTDYDSPPQLITVKGESNISQGR